MRCLLLVGALVLARVPRGLRILVSSLCSWMRYTLVRLLAPRRRRQTTTISGSGAREQQCVNANSFGAVNYLRASPSMGVSFSQRF